MNPVGVGYSLHVLISTNNRNYPSNDEGFQIENKCISIFLIFLKLVHEKTFKPFILNNSGNKCISEIWNILIIANNHLNFG